MERKRMKQQQSGPQEGRRPNVCLFLIGRRIEPEDVSDQPFIQKERRILHGRDDERVEK